MNLFISNKSLITSLYIIANLRNVTSVRVYIGEIGITIAGWNVRSEEKLFQWSIMKM